MEITVITQNAGAEVTLTLKNSLTAPIVVVSDSNRVAVFSDVNGTHEITTNDKIESITNVVN